MDMREKIQRFMIGRYGADELSRFCSGAVMGLLILSLFRKLGLGYLYWVALALLIYSTWRILSRNISKRYEENQKFLNWKFKMTQKTDKIRKRWQQRKIYRFFKCPQCKQTVRVPKGHGKICITCPKCRTEFVKKS